MLSKAVNRVETLDKCDSTCRYSTRTTRFTALDRINPAPTGFSGIESRLWVRGSSYRCVASDQSHLRLRHHCLLVASLIDAEIFVCLLKIRLLIGLDHQLM